MIRIKVNRDSVCMGDDCFSHMKEYELNDDPEYSDLFNILKTDNYFPYISGNNVVWVMTVPDGGLIFSYFTKTGKIFTYPNGKRIKEICKRSENFHLKYYTSPLKWKEELCRTDGDAEEIKYCDEIMLSEAPRENSRVRIKDLIDKYPYEKVEEKIKLHYDSRNLDKFKKLYSDLQKLETDDVRDFYICITAFRKTEDDPEPVEDFDENDNSLYFDVSGYNLTEPYAYSIIGTKFAEFLKCRIDNETLRKYSGENILAHCLWEITFFGFDDTERGI